MLILIYNLSIYEMLQVYLYHEYTCNLYFANVTNIRKHSSPRLFLCRNSQVRYLYVD